MNSHKATIPLPRIKKSRARIYSSMSREIVEETSSGEKQTYFIEPFLVRNAYETGSIKNLKNLNIGTDSLCKQRRPRSGAAENKGMKLI